MLEWALCSLTGTGILAFAVEYQNWQVHHWRAVHINIILPVTSVCTASLLVGQ